MSKSLLSIIITVLLLTGCASAKPYSNQYGGFDNKADADCAFLIFQRDAKKQLGNKWGDIYQKCREMSESGTPLTPVVYNEIVKNPQVASSRGMGNAFLAIAQMILVQQMISQQIEGGSMQTGQCNSISIAPIAAPRCKNICINGRWAEVC